MSAWFGEIVGQFGLDAGGLGQGPTRARADPRCATAAARRRWQRPPASLGFAPELLGGRRRRATLRRIDGRPRPVRRRGGRRRVRAWALLEQRHDNEVQPDEMVDDIPHAPLRTRGRRRPLVGSYPVDQVAHSCGCTCETVEASRGCHPVRLERPARDHTGFRPAPPAGVCVPQAVLPRLRWSSSTSAARDETHRRTATPSATHSPRTTVAARPATPRARRTRNAGRYQAGGGDVTTRQ